MSVGEALGRSALFRRMPASDRAAFARHGRMRRYAKGSYLWREGDEEDGLHVLLEGFVHIGLIGPDAEEVVFHVVAPGDTLGEPGVYSPERDRRTDARAVERVATVNVPSHAVRDVLERSPEAMRVFLERVSAIARGHSRRIALTAFHDARGRIARLLLDLVDSHGERSATGVRIALPLSQRTLAGLVSLRRESVNRILAAYEQEGALAFDDGVITVLEQARLRAALGFDWLPA